jgi:hypothetical protein
MFLKVEAREQLFSVPQRRNKVIGGTMFPKLIWSIENGVIVTGAGKLPTGPCVQGGFSRVTADSSEKPAAALQMQPPEPYLTACLTRISVLVLPWSSACVFHERVDLSPREALISNFSSRE